MKVLRQNAFIAVRRPADGEEWLDTGTMDLLRDECEKKARVFATDYPTLNAVQPIDRVIPVQIVPDPIPSDLFETLLKSHLDRMGLPGVLDMLERYCRQQAVDYEQDELYSEERRWRLIASSLRNCAIEVHEAL